MPIVQAVTVGQALPSVSTAAKERFGLQLNDFNCQKRQVRRFRWQNLVRNMGWFIDPKGIGSS